MLEACSGATTLRDTPPEEWNMKDSKKTKRFVPNTLLVHRVVEEAGCLYWRTTLEERRLTGFCVKEELIKDQDMRVWPP